uniref:Bulb-type lectin domain-containing protein n=1 Tax=Opuntia streptacantha TaxID=393608 RepID=A0A7C9CNQ3_OPUST
MSNLAFCRTMPIFSVILKFVSFAVFFAFGSCATNSVTQDQVYRDGQTPLISANGSFEFGFFSPPNSSLRYVGIWYSNTSVQSLGRVKVILQLGITQWGWILGQHPR